MRVREVPLDDDNVYNYGCEDKQKELPHSGVGFRTVGRLLRRVFRDKIGIINVPKQVDPHDEKSKSGDEALKKQ